MAKGFTAQQFIDAPADRVWAAATNVARMHEWMPGVLSVAEANDEPMQAGKRFIVVLETRGRGSKREMTLCEWRPPHRFALASKEGSVSATYAYEISPSGDGAQVTLEGTCTAGSFFMKLLQPLISHMMAKHDRPQVDLLKQMVEA